MPHSPLLVIKSIEKLYIQSIVLYFQLYNSDKHFIFKFINIIILLLYYLIINMNVNYIAYTGFKMI